MAEPVTSTNPTTRESFVPPLVRAASEWAWRSIVIGLAVVALLYLLGFLSEVVIPLTVGTVAVRPAVVDPPAARAGHASRSRRRGDRPGDAAGHRRTAGAGRDADLGWLRHHVGAGRPRDRADPRLDPEHLGVSDDQFGEYLEQIKQFLSSANLGSSLSKAGITAGHFVAGTFIALFALFFFLYDGPRIWAWLVRLFPRVARDRVDSSGTVAWGQLTAYTRATVLVAAVDAVGITAGALILRVPFALAIGVLVFLLSFIPIVGALLSGAVAVLIALVAQGPVTALIMLAVVIGVQQLESHVLQPFILGRSVRVHPLAVIAAIATGAILAGIVGTLVAVPVVAVVKAVAEHLFRHDDNDDSEEVGGSPPDLDDAPLAAGESPA